MACLSSFYIPGSASFQPACPDAGCGLEARAPRPSGHEMACLFTGPVLVAAEVIKYLPERTDNGESSRRSEQQEESPG
jgi:hypothetical protein